MVGKQKIRSSVASSKATGLLTEAFEIYYAQNNGIKESSRHASSIVLNSYKAYCEAIGKDDVSMLTQKGVNAYKDYLVTQREQAKRKGKRYISNTQINNKCEIIVRLVNKIILSNSEFSKYWPLLSKLEYNKLREIKPKNEWKKRRPLRPQELDMLSKCDTLTPREEEYRDIFLLQCECGCRISDIGKLFAARQHKRIVEGGKEFYVIDTLKEHIRAYVMITPVIRGILAKYASGFHYADPNRGLRFANNCNIHLKTIFRKSGLTSNETYKTSCGKIENTPLCDIITTHYARYTFIFNGLFVKGFTPDELKHFTGHANDKMINEVYAVYSEEDEAKTVIKAIERVRGKKSINDIAVNEQQQSTTLTTYVMHCRDILAWLGEPRANYVNISHPQELARLITAKYEVPLAGMGWTIETIERLYKDNDTEGYECLKADIKKLRLFGLNQ